MQIPNRTFEVYGAGATMPLTALIIGLAGETGTGKTVSAIRLGLGIASVLKTRLCVVDTEGLRALNYRKPRGPYEFDYVDFAPPFGPLDYIAAIEAAVKTGAKVIVVDSCSHEHAGEGGVMDQIDRFLDDKCGDDYSKRERYNMIAHAKVKPQRKKLNNYIIQLSRQGVVLILCYRASDKVKPASEADKRANPQEKIKHVGFVPETTSPLRYEMTQAFLLLPGAKGKPVIKPETADEQIWSKTPMQFEGWNTGQQLDESFGEKLARWAVGGAEVRGSSPAPATVHPPFSDAEAEGKPKPVIRLMMLYNALAMLAEQDELAAVPARYFVLKYKVYPWDQVLSVKAEKYLAWINDTIVPAMEARCAELQTAQPAEELQLS
jgi:hypothetical protein